MASPCSSDTAGNLICQATAAAVVWLWCFLLDFVDQLTPLAWRGQHRKLWPLIGVAKTRIPAAAFTNVPTHVLCLNPREFC